MFILASKSPRRKELLSSLIKDFLIVPSNIDESKYKLEELSIKKAEAIAIYYPNDYILSADTYVILDEIVYGKPKDKDDAYKILNSLQNKTHNVTTYFTIMNEQKSICITKRVDTLVRFNKMTKEEILNYIASNSPMDKAGAYGIQDNDKYHFIHSIEGSLTNVIGLPVDELKKVLIELNII